MEKNDFHSKHDRESLKIVRGDNDVLKMLIASLSSKLTNVSSHIEKEFLSAYRVHMLSVQEELRDLKSQVVDAEVALNDDEEVSRLEHEVTWFSDETTRLRNQSNSMRKDMNHVMTRIVALREQRQYLNEQLKTTLKRSRILEAELNMNSGRSQAAASGAFEGDFESRGDGFEDFGADGQMGYMQEQDALERMGDSRTLSKASSKMAKSKSVSALPSIRMKFKPKKPVVQDVLVTKRAGRGGIVPNAMSAIDELKTLEDSRQNIELDLEAALRSVFSEIIDRKVKALERTSKNKSDNESTWRIDAASGGLTGLGLAHFSDTDRLSAIATFLGTPHYFKAISETLSYELEL